MMFSSSGQSPGTKSSLGRLLSWRYCIDGSLAFSSVSICSSVCGMMIETRYYQIEVVEVGKSKAGEAVCCRHLPPASSSESRQQMQGSQPWP